MKLYVIESGYYNSEGSIEDKVFKTKKDCHKYMEWEYSCHFKNKKKYDYYYNEEIEIWYTLVDVEYIKNIDKYIEEKE